MASKPRVSTIVDENLAHWLRSRAESENRSVSTLVREILTEYHRDQEERYWATEGEARLATFDERSAVSHEDAWA